MSGETRNEGGEDTRAVCKYGTKCYRKNPVHFEEYRHPGKYEVTCDIMLWGSYCLVICTTPSPFATSYWVKFVLSILHCFAANIGRFKKD